MGKGRMPRALEGKTVADRYCSYCGHELAEDTRFCPNCGRPVHETAHVPTPEADVPVPPPPQHAGGTAPAQETTAPTQGRSRGRTVVLGCLAVFGLLFLLIVAAAIGGGGGDQASSPPERAEQNKGLDSGGKNPEANKPLQGEKAKPQEEPADQNQEKVYSIGEEVRVGDVSYTVTNARKATQLRDTYGIDPPKRGNFVVVDFIFSNNGNEPVNMSDVGLYVYDGEGRQYETDSDMFGYIPENKDIFLLERVNPGMSREAQVIYSVPPDASGFQLEVTSGFWQSEVARIKLGF
jgi:hypothetical protein